MADVRTTLSIEADLYEGMKKQYRDLGFSRMADLVNQAVRDYLLKRKSQERDRLMQVAAENPAYRALVGEISREFAQVDSEGLGPEY